MTNFQPYKDILFYRKVVALKAVLLDRGLAHESCRTQTQTNKKINKSRIKLFPSNDGTIPKCQIQVNVFKQML